MRSSIRSLAFLLSFFSNTSNYFVFIMPTIHSIITKLQVYDANDEIEDLLRNPKARNERYYKKSTNIMCLLSLYKNLQNQ